MISGITNYMPSLSMPKMASPAQMLTNAAKIALPMIALVGLTYAKSADAGPVAYGSCMTLCLAATWGGFAPVCATICAPAMAAPTP